MKKYARYLSPVVGLLILAFLLAHYDIHQVTSLLKGADVGWLLVMALCLIISTLIGALNVFLLFRPEDRPIGFKEFLSIYWFGWALALVVPGQVGDVASTTVLLQRRGVKVQKSLSLLLLDKVISLLTMVCFAAIGMLAVGKALEVTLVEIAKLEMWIALFVVLGLVGLLLLRSKWFKSTRIGSFIIGTLHNVYETCIKYPAVVFRNIIFTIIKVFLIGLAYAAAFWALGVEGPTVISITGLALASGLIAYLPISFNGLGTVEFAGVLLFKAIGIPEQVTLSAYILLRLSGLLIAWIPNIFTRPLARTVES